MSFRDKILSSVRGRSESPAPSSRAPRPESTGRSNANANVNANTLTPVPSRPRLPSVDSINRSSHNAIDVEDDGSEVSKDKIIASLKKANAALTTKTAEMEATFMNQCNVLAAEISTQQTLIEEREQENKQLKTKINSHEGQLKEGIQIITALEKEKQFQKQTITDLKNQFFQLQKDVEDKSEEAALHKDRMVQAEKRADELEKERNSLRLKVDETSMQRDSFKAAMTQLQKERDSSPNTESIEIAIQDNDVIAEKQYVTSPSSNSVQSAASEIRQNWRKLEEKKEQLESALALLHETQSSLATLEHKHKDLQKQFDDRLLQRYDEIKTELQKETDELKSTAIARDETIAKLHERLETYNDDLTKAEDEVDRLNAEIDKSSPLITELDETKKQLQAERDLNAELADKYDNLSMTVEQLEQQSENLRVKSVIGVDDDKDERIEDLEKELNVCRNKLEEEKKQADMLLNTKIELEKEFTMSSNTANARLEQLEEENDQLKGKLENYESKNLDNAVDSDMKEDYAVKVKELEDQLTEKNEKVLELQITVEMHSTELQATKKVYEEEISSLSSKISQGKESLQGLQKDLDKSESMVQELKDDLSKNQEMLKTAQSEAKAVTESMKEKEQLLEEKENQIKDLENDVARLNATAEQKQLDKNAEIKVLEDSWRSQKNNILKESNHFESKLVEALKELDSNRVALQEMKVEEETWTVEKEKFSEEKNALEIRIKTLNDASTEASSKNRQTERRIANLVKEKEKCEKNLENARKESGTLKKQIGDLERRTSDQEKKLKIYKADAALVNKLKSSNDKLQKELDAVKLQVTTEKQNHQKVVASISSRDDGKMKRGDKLRIIELSEEVDKLRSKLRLVQTDGDKAGKYKNDAARVYSMAKDTHHKKELSNLEEKLRSEIKELKSKLSDRDTTIAATLRSSVLQDQKINSLREKIKGLTLRHKPLEPDANSEPEDREAFEDLENLRESVQNHEETQKSLTHQIKTLKKQLAEAKKANSSSSNSNSSTTNLEKEIEDYKTKVKERDGAIQTLVKSSITQEQQISALRDELSDLKHLKSQNRESKTKGPSWTELERLQQESEIFAGQIIEQDEEIEDLRRLLKDAQEHSTENDKLRKLINDLHEQLDEQYQMRDEENSNKRTISDAIRLELEEEKRKREDLKDALTRELEAERIKRENIEQEMMDVQSIVSKTEKQDLKLTKIKDELDEVEEANEKLQSEIRDLRRKLRTSQLEAERVNDLEIELEYLRKTKSTRNSEDLRLREKYDALDAEAQLMKKMLETKEEEYAKVQETCRKLEEVIAVCREEKDELRDEFSGKQIKIQHSEQSLRVELAEAIRDRSLIEAKLKTLEENEAKMKGEMEAHKALREVSLKDKENYASKASQDITMYQMKIGELEKANENQTNVIENLTQEIQLLQNTQMNQANINTESTEIIAALTAEVKKLRNENMANRQDEESAEIIAALSEEVRKLRNNQDYDNSDEIIAALTQEVKRLHLLLKQQPNQSDPNELERVIRSEVEQEMQSIRNQKDFLGKENLDLQAKINTLESGKLISSLKQQVQEAEKGRTLFEKTMISTYERKLNLMQMNKDLTIDGLQKDLTQSKESMKEMETDLLNKIMALETEKNELEAELKAKMQHKNAKIKFLEQTLSAHEQVAGHMKDELDQLQNGMETVSVTRRAELEELQEDLITVQSKAAKYEREIAGLKMKLDDQKAHYKNEISKLHYHMEEMQMDNDDSPTIRQIAEKDRMAVNEMAKQVEALRAKVSTLQMENFDLREKIDKDETSSRTSKNDKWRNSALQEQVQVLTRRLRELEGGDDASLMSSSTRRSKRSTKSSSSLRIPTTPKGGGISSSRRGVRNGDDISTHTENTC